jgi:SSS family solute:Na+ symporter/sodium/pantothenate symporter
VDKLTIAWIAFGVYILATTGLALRGMFKTKDLAGFALGNRDMGPVLVGITLAAATASSATFVINPGFVYAHGLSALLHFGVAAVSGIIVGLVLMSKGFRKHGNKSSALTLPHWIGARYQHGGMRTYFALLNLVLAITFVVLIIKGSALVMQHTLATSYEVSVVIIVGFVFSYILMGGTYAHAYTNAMQGSLMIVVAFLLFGSGLHLLGDGIGPFFSELAAQDKNLVKPINPESPLFGSFWDVAICGFVVSFGLVCQPHILTKSLYLEHDRDVNRYLLVASVSGVIFALILFVGLYARVMYAEMPSQDAVVAAYIAKTFTPVVGVLISVALLAAGMSTMDGILVAASTIAGNDIFNGVLGRKLMGDRSEEERQRLALKASRWILVGMGVVAFAIAYDPPEYVGLFGMMGIYGLIAAALAPVALGIFVRELDARDAFFASVAGPVIHFTHYGYVEFVEGGFINPATTATEGIFAAFAILGGMTLLRRKLARSSVTQAPPAPAPATATETDSPAGGE